MSFCSVIGAMKAVWCHHCFIKIFIGNISTENHFINEYTYTKYVTLKWRRSDGTRREEGREMR